VLEHRTALILVEVESAFDNADWIIFLEKNKRPHGGSVEPQASLHFI